MDSYQVISPVRKLLGVAVGTGTDDNLEDLIEQNDSIVAKSNQFVTVLNSSTNYAKVAQVKDHVESLIFTGESDQRENDSAKSLYPIDLMN